MASNAFLDNGKVGDERNEQHFIDRGIGFQIVCERCEHLLVLCGPHELRLHPTLLNLKQHRIPSKQISVDLVVHAPFLGLSEHESFKQLITGDELSAELIGFVLIRDNVRSIVNHLNKVARYVSKCDRCFTTITFLSFFLLFVILDLLFEVFAKLTQFFLFSHCDRHRRDEVLVDVLEENKCRFLQCLNLAAENVVQVVLHMSFKHLLIDVRDANKEGFSHFLQHLNFKLLETTLHASCLLLDSPVEPHSTVLNSLHKDGHNGHG